jgi:hypothetical protein
VASPAPKTPKKGRKKPSVLSPEESIANDIANTKRIKRDMEKIEGKLDDLINNPPANENPEQPSTQPVPALSPSKINNPISPSKSNKNVKFSQVQSSKSLSSIKHHEPFFSRRLTRSGKSLDADSKDLDYEDPTEKKSSKKS